MRVGVVGLGKMGSAIAKRLIGTGIPVTGWDCSDEANEDARRAGVVISLHPRELISQTDLVISFVTNDASVWDVFTGSDGFLSTSVRGKLFMEMSTLRPTTGEDLAKLVAASGGRFLDAPVLGTIAQADEGTLIALVGGEADDVRAATTIFDIITQRLFHLGPNGYGYSMKLCVNLGLAAYVQAIAEALALGNKRGLNTDQILDVLEVGPLSTGWLRGKRSVIMGEESKVTLDINTMGKDVMSAVVTGALAGVPMPMSSSVLSVFSAAIAAGAGKQDLAHVANFYRNQMVPQV